MRALHNQLGALDRWLDRNVSTERAPVSVREFLAHLILIVLGGTLIFGLLILRTGGFDV